MAVREAVPILRRASGRRVGEGALAAGGGVWLPRPVALERMPSALEAGMRAAREGSGVEDNIRVITGRWPEAGALGHRLPWAPVCSLKTFVCARTPCPGGSFYVCSAAPVVGCPVTMGRGPPHARCVASPFVAGIFMPTITLLG